MVLELQQITTIKNNGSVLTAGGVQCCDSDRTARQLSSADAARASNAPEGLNRTEDAGKPHSASSAGLALDKYSHQLTYCRKKALERIA